MKLTNPSALNTLHPVVQPPEGDSKMETKLVRLQNGIPATTSLIVGQEFGKDHKHVLRSIEGLITEMGMCTEDFTEPKIGPSSLGSTEDQILVNDSAAGSRNYFIQSSYTDSTGRTLPMYIITEEGFALLAMGFTGTKALEFKLKFLDQYKALVTEVTCLQAENFALLENKTKLLESKVAAFDAKHWEIVDRNEYLEGKNSLVIDDHELKQMHQAYKEVCAVLREAQNEMCSGEWAEGTSKSNVRTLQNLAMQRMKNILRITKNLREYFKKSHLTGEGTLESYISGIEYEAKHLQW